MVSEDSTWCCPYLMQPPDTPHSILHTLTQAQKRAAEAALPFHLT